MNNPKPKKYHVGRYDKFGQHRGFFIGSFLADDNPGKTDKVEVLYRELEKGFTTKSHYHQEKIEIVIIIDGKARYTINHHYEILEKGMFVLIEANSIISCEYLEPTKIFVIHSPCIPEDVVYL